MFAAVGLGAWAFVHFEGMGHFQSALGEIANLGIWGTVLFILIYIVARHAGEMIGEITTAMAGGVGLGKMASVIHPYPTQVDAIRKCGDQFNKTRLTPTVKKLMSKWLSWRR